MLASYLYNVENMEKPRYEASLCGRGEKPHYCIADLLTSWHYAGICDHHCVLNVTCMSPSVDQYIPLPAQCHILYTVNLVVIIINNGIPKSLEDYCSTVNTVVFLIMIPSPS